MSREHSIAMDMAIDLYRGTEVSADRLVQTAEMIRLYREGKLKIRGLSIDNDRQGRRLPIDNSDSLRVSSSEISSLDGIGGVLVGRDQVVGQPLDQILPGVSNSHTNSSSVATGDESVGEVATPSRTKSVGDDGECGK